MNVATKKRLEMLQSKRGEIAKAISKLEAAENIRKNARLVGKTFKAKGERSFAIVTRIDNNGWVYFNAFYMDRFGNVRVSVGYLGYHMGADWQRIPKARYKAARKRCLAICRSKI